jgi:hypothetical protein
MLRQGCLESGFHGMREFGNAQSHTRSKDKNRSVAGRMHEGWLHQGKSEDVPETGQRNSFDRAVHPAESAVREKREREEDASLIFLVAFKPNRAVEKSRRDFCLRVFFAGRHKFRAKRFRSAVRPRIAFILSTLVFPMRTSEPNTAFRKATRGRVRTPKASRNLACSLGGG